MLAKEMWDTLSKIDVSKNTEKKGKFTYLSWSWAWAEFSKLYPDCDYEMSDRAFPDGTMEVYCKMIVFGDGGQRDVKRNMWLPVLNHQNKPIKDPNSFDVNNAKMRCLVKCLAMFGLGHYIYAGEDLPEATGSLDSPETTNSLDMDMSQFLKRIEAAKGVDELRTEYFKALEHCKLNGQDTKLFVTAKNKRKEELK